MARALGSLLSAMVLSSSMAFGAGDLSARVGPAAIYLNFSTSVDGIDQQTLNLAKEYLAQAEGRRLVIDKTWDRRRNGSTYLCIQFVDALERYKFMRAVMDSIRLDYQKTGIERTTVYVGMRCRQIRKANRVNLDLKWVR